MTGKHSIEHLDFAPECDVLIRPTEAGGELAECPTPAAWAVHRHPADYRMCNGVGPEWVLVCPEHLNALQRESAAHADKYRHLGADRLVKCPVCGFSTVGRVLIVAARSLRVPESR